MKKGEIDDHTIFLGCLFMSVKNEFKEKNPDVFESNLKTDEETGQYVTSIISPKTAKAKKSKFEIEEEDIEKRVFICVGSLKQRRTKHLWIMTINSDYKGVRFWEVTNNTSFLLDCRVASSENLEKYLNKEDIEFKFLQLDMQEDHKSNRDESVEIPTPEDSMSDDYGNESDEEDGAKDKKKNGDALIRKNDLAQAELRFKHKSIGIQEDKGKPIGKSYLDKKRDDEKRDKQNYISIVQEPRHLPGAKEVDVPYRTIDMIFNNKNIYMNMQHYDPARIIYDIYDDTLWSPFMPGNQKIFGAFYAPPILYPPLHLPSAKKLHENIIKEIKIGISALRSGKNLGTSWKNQKDTFVDLMETHLKFFELAARGEFTEEESKSEKFRWSRRIRQFMPKYYRMTAIPAHFNYPEPDRITSVLLEKAKDFFVADHKNIKWAVAVRIFPYVGKVISIRTLVAAIYPVPGGVNQEELLD